MWGRVSLAAAYLCLQAVLIATSARRPDHAFGFQMFSESTTGTLTLLREVEAPSGHGTILVPVNGGEWTAPDETDARHRFEWQARVKTPVLAVFDAPFEVGYGQAAETERLRAALADVASHLDGDTETRRLVIEAVFRKNGGEPVTVRLASPTRPEAK